MCFTRFPASPPFLCLGVLGRGLPTFRAPLPRRRSLPQTTPPKRKGRPARGRPFGRLRAAPPPDPSLRLLPPRPLPPGERGTKKGPARARARPAPNSHNPFISNHSIPYDSILSSQFLQGFFRVAPAFRCQGFAGPLPPAFPAPHIVIRRTSWAMKDRGGTLTACPPQPWRKRVLIARPFDRLRASKAGGEPLLCRKLLAQPCGLPSDCRRSTRGI